MKSCIAESLTKKNEQLFNYMFFSFIFDISNAPDNKCHKQKLLCYFLHASNQWRVSWRVHMQSLASNGEDCIETKKQKQESQKSQKPNVVADEINALQEKRIKLISKIEMLCVDADLLAVKTESLHDFRYLMQSNQQKKTC